MDVEPKRVVVVVVRGYETCLRVFVDDFGGSSRRV